MAEIVRAHQISMCSLHALASLVIILGPCAWFFPMDHMEVMRVISTGRQLRCM